MSGRFGGRVADLDLGLLHKVRVDLLERRGAVGEQLTQGGLAQEGRRDGRVIEQGAERGDAARAHLGLSDDALLNGARERVDELGERAHDGVGRGLDLEALAFGNESAVGTRGYECRERGIDGLGGADELLQRGAVFVDGASGL